MTKPSDSLRAVGVIYADKVKEGDVVFASYTRSEDEKMVCAWVIVKEVKHHTDVTVTWFSEPIDDRSKLRWVEYPRSAPLVMGFL